jgi:hypothetical protein
MSNLTDVLQQVIINKGECFQMEAPRVSHPRALRQKDQMAIKKKKKAKMDSSIKALVRLSLPLSTYSSEPKLIYGITILAGRSRSAGEDRSDGKSCSSGRDHLTRIMSIGLGIRQRCITV